MGNRHEGIFRMTLDNNKKIRSISYLLLIPIQFFLDILVLLLAGYVDTKIIPNGEGLGHPFPVITMLVGILFGVITIIIIVISIILTIRGFIRKRRQL